VGVGATIYARDRKLIKNTIYTMVAAIDWALKYLFQNKLNMDVVFRFWFNN
jgi:hypothetical protein